MGISLSPPFLFSQTYKVKILNIFKFEYFSHLQPPHTPLPRGQNGKYTPTTVISLLRYIGYH